MSPPATVPLDPLTLLPSSNTLKLSPEPFNAVAGQSLVLQRRPTPPPLNTLEIVVQVCLSTSSALTRNNPFFFFFFNRLKSPLSNKRMDADASMQMNIETLRLDQLAEGQKGAHEPSDKLLNDENLPTLVKETGECLGQLEIPANTQLTPQVGIDHSLLIHPATKMPAIRRLPSVPPENESNKMDVDTTAVPVTSPTGTHAPTTTTNGTQVYSLPQSSFTSGDSQGE